MNELQFPNYLSLAMERLSKGAFLTTAYGGTINTMTISWGSFGIMWGKPVCTVMVRPSRYTYGLIEKAGEFTLSIPLNDSLAQALALCGSKSGRDMNKFSAAGLTVASARMVNTPVIEGPCLYLECKILYRQTMAQDGLGAEQQNQWYANGDYHTLYAAEIVAAYQP